MINNPKDFFQQIQNLVEGVALKVKALGDSLSSFLPKSDAEATYLAKTEAANTYLGKDEKAESAKTADTATSANNATNDANGNNIGNTYLKNTVAQSTYLSKTDASSTYLEKTGKAASAMTADGATKATQDGNGANIANTYLPKTGGTMTGDIKFSGFRNIMGTTDTGSIQIYGGTDWEAGSMIGVYGKSHSSRAGWIYLSSHDGTNTNVLVVKPDGTFQWGGKNVIRSVNGTAADASGNVTVSSSTPTKLTTGTCTISSKKIYAPSGGTWFIFGYYSYQYRLDDDAGTTYPTQSVFVCKQYAGGALIADLNKSDYTNHNVSLLMCLRVA